MLSAGLNSTQNIVHENEHGLNVAPTFNPQGQIPDNILGNNSSNASLIQEQHGETRESGMNISQDLQNTAITNNDSEGKIHISSNLHPGQHSVEQILAKRLVENTKNEDHHSSNNEKQWLLSHLGSSEQSHHSTNLAQEIIRAHGIDEEKLKKNLKG